MPLSSRLKTIADLIDPTDIVADIGSDHGLLVLELRLRNPQQTLYATDFKDGPYTRLQQTLHGTSIHVYQADGLQHLPSEVNTIVMSGMGGLTIGSILNQFQSNPFGGKLIVSPQSDIPFVRTTLNDLGYRMIKETLIFDHKYYVIIVAIPGQQILTPIEIQYGPILLKEKSITFQKYIHDSLLTWRERLAQVRHNLQAASAIENTIKELESLC